MLDAQKLTNRITLTSSVNDPKNQARSISSSVRRFQLGIRDCMAEKMGVVDDNGEFIEERVRAGV